MNGGTRSLERIDAEFAGAKYQPFKGRIRAGVDAVSVVELLLAGGLLGLLGGMLGIGGGIFAIPLLGIAFGLNEQHAQGTALVMVVPTVAVGLWDYAKKTRMDARIGIALAAAAFPCTFLGAQLATRVPSSPLRIAFACFALCIAVYMSFQALARRHTDAVTREARPWRFALGIGAFGGFISGAFSVGGAIFSVPLVSYFFVLPQAVAQGFGLALVAPGTLAGIVTYGWAGDIDWNLGVPLALGSVLTVRYGVTLAHRLPERRLQLVFAGLMVVSAIGLLLKV
jgi:uncharacterized membrane protein YfcA